VVALTGIEPAGRQFSSVQLSLSSCVFGLVQFATMAFRPIRVADVLPRCCPAAKIRFLNIRDRFASGAIQGSPTFPATVQSPGPNRLLLYLQSEDATWGVAQLPVTP
jgi:hypothetical protein